MHRNALELQDFPFFASRTTARTCWPAESKVRATAPPTLPVIPVTAYIRRMAPLLGTVEEDPAIAFRRVRSMPCMP